MKLNYYQILGVSRNASMRVIKSAYRFLVYHFHPDRNNNSEGELLKINEAYRVLSNPNEKIRYDYSIGESDSICALTPKIKWINEALDQTTKPLDSVSLSEAKGIKKDMINLITYLNICPLYESYNYGTNSTPIIHTMRMK